MKNYSTKPDTKDFEEKNYFSPETEAPKVVQNIHVVISRQLCSKLLRVRSDLCSARENDAIGSFLFGKCMKFDVLACRKVLTFFPML